MKFIVLAIFVMAVVQGRLPDGVFQKCHLNDPKIDQCLLTSLEHVKGAMKDGVPAISFPPLDPFRMDILKVDTVMGGIRLRGEIGNIYATGAGDYHISNLKVDIPKRAAEITVVVPKLELSCDYAANESRIVLIKVTASGKFKATFFNVKTTVKAESTVVKGEGGLDYLKLTRFKTSIDFGPGTKIFVQPASKTIQARTTANFINNANADGILRHLKPFIDIGIGRLLQKLVSKVLKKLPVQDLLEY